MSVAPAYLRFLQEESASDTSVVLAAVLSNVFLFCLVFGLSATVHVKSLKQQLTNWFALSTGIVMQFVIMPLLGYITVMILKKGEGFSQAMGLMLLVVMSSPGGSYSNLWCSLFNADLSLSVAMTSVSTILSVGMLPANLSLYSYLAYGGGSSSSSSRVGEDKSDSNLVGALNFGKIFISLGVVMGAIVSGLASSYALESPTFQKWANRGASVSGIALILVSFLLSSGTETNIWNQHWRFYIGVCSPCVVGLVLANVVSRCCRLPKSECVAISIECCYQNTGIATSVAVTMFTDPEVRAQAVAVPLLYGLVEAVVICIYCVFAWKAGWTKAPASDNLCVVISKSYEVMQDDNDDELKDTHQDELDVESQGTNELEQKDGKEEMVDIPLHDEESVNEDTLCDEDLVVVHV